MYVLGEEQRQGCFILVHARMVYINLNKITLGYAYYVWNHYCGLATVIILTIACICSYFKLPVFTAV